MNPCHTRWAVPIDDVNVHDQERCELCGGLKKDHSSNLSPVQLASGSMWLIRMAERIMWGNHRPHGIGSLLLVTCAKLLNPGASMSSIAAATGLTKQGVQSAIDRLREVSPDVHAALWLQRSEVSERKG